MNFSLIGKNLIFVFMVKYPKLRRKILDVLQDEVRKGNFNMEKTKVLNFGIAVKDFKQGERKPKISLSPNIIVKLVMNPEIENRIVRVCVDHFSD
jgi:hypothetical protein